MLFGPSFKLDIATGKDVFLYEEPIEYKVILDVKKSKEIKQLKTRFDVVLEGTTTCWYEEYGEDEEREYSRPEIFWFTLTRHEEKLLEKTKPDKGRQEFTVSVPPPIGMPLPGDYKIFKIEWKITAEIPGLLRKTKTEKKLTIKRPEKPGPKETYNKSLEGLKVAANIPKYIPLGSEFSLDLEISPETGEIECKELSITLVNSLRIPREDIDPSAKDCKEFKYEKIYKEMTLGKNLRMRETEPFKETITLSIPADAYPSFNHSRSYSIWKINVSCKKGFMKSTKIEIPLVIV